MEPSATTHVPPELEDLPGVGPSRARKLLAFGVRAPRDLLGVLPLGLEEAPPRRPIAAAADLRGREVRVAGTVERTSLARFGRRSVLRVLVRDDSGSIAARFFNQPWLQRRFAVGDAIELWGRVTAAGELAIDAPRAGTAAHPLPVPGTLRALHPAGDGLSAELIGSLCRRVAEALAGTEPEPVPRAQLERLGLCDLPSAYREVHAPTSRAAFGAARGRLALERLLELQARLEARRRRRSEGRALACPSTGARRAELEALFPFALTDAQRRVAREVADDLARPQPMRRLLQGDVGSGKTALGVWGALLVAGAGGQTAFLAPTEILAEQHHLGLAPLCARAGLRTALLTGSLAARERRAVHAALAAGEVDVVFGTHALFSEAVTYRRLALAVVDEQHRFGVAQRGELFDKGRDVHVLLMTATPIPRTLALALYGDLDTSVLDAKPPGRGPVTTRWVRGKRTQVERFLVERVAAGERLYWVVPRIGGEEDRAQAGVGGRAASAEARHARLAASPLAEHGLELVHGRMPAAERARRLERFRSGDVRTLVATTVVEVGVDVPEATLMVVEGAERLGLAQLHQLRGRVGRGARESWFLIYGAESGAERFRLLESTHDGFAIAEEDLRLRGMGDLAGLRQAGANTEGLAEWGSELALFHAAQRLVSESPELFEHYARRAHAAPGP